MSKEELKEPTAVIMAMHLKLYALETSISSLHADMARALEENGYRCLCEEERKTLGANACNSGGVK